jgi:hypothetical protein
MKSLALTAILTLAIVPTTQAQSRRRGAQPAPENDVNLAKLAHVQAPQPDGALSCQCHQLVRVITGLRALGSVADEQAFARAYPREQKALVGKRSQLDGAVEGAERALGSARGKGYLEQETLCQGAANALNSYWKEWQPFLAQTELDRDYFDGVKVSNPAVPDHGDENPDHRGRHCKSGQWWEEDRALWAITGREGICEQEHYRIEQVLKGQKGERGYRCYEYKLK